MVHMGVSPLFTTIMDSKKWVWREWMRTEHDVSRARPRFVAHDMDLFFHTHAKDDGGCSCTNSSDPCIDPGKSPRRVRPTRQVEMTPSIVPRITDPEPLPPTSR